MGRVQRARVSPERVAYLDNLKVLLIAAIIAGHGTMGYSAFEAAWPYQEVREVRLAEVSDIALGMVVLFAMGLFFLISGLVTPGSLARKGPRTFARDRLVRLGVPLAVWVLFLWPAAGTGDRGPGRARRAETAAGAARPHLTAGAR